MYIPETFQEVSRSRQLALMERHSFATLISVHGTSPFASHLPLLLEQVNGKDVLRGHMARANPQWQHFKGTEVMAIFQGPHAYISAGWYAAQSAVPTWNYAAIHVYGTATTLCDHQEVRALLAKTVDVYEARVGNPWDRHISDDVRDQLLKGIVAFEICIERIEAKFKLNQNRPVEDIDRVIAALSAQGGDMNSSLADLMRGSVAEPG